MGPARRASTGGTSEKRLDGRERLGEGGTGGKESDEESSMGALCTGFTLVRKIVKLVIYKFIHGTSPNHIGDHLKVGYSTARKYIEIVCDIFTNE